MGLKVVFQKVMLVALIMFFSFSGDAVLKAVGANGLVLVEWE